ncbi:hypothetical protein SYNPS1DRAFT_22828 [Syncephalis pseudoplumigaleata]|uniref:SWR1-complex protein 4 n=1 Tax=Syncephalis pseudoplumigaleata TaxID=1712513 RepID=A0A4P9Z1A5_9FUNG|nr:hypothetical protein SYNPS1DRAFT_22828 [Syncephalis pseudoplumigaleata]|eukprot:RKP25170.1 hypothetical protein SYNPS1DRAFT_22828 [Syncephalis pseudoplumigaleata]
MNTQDARDILELDAASQKPTATSQRRSGTLPKKPEGVNRELFNLIGGLATVPVSEHRVQFKEKPSFAAKPSSSRWTKKGFTNSARSDDLVLYHWVNEADESTDLSSDWSKEETDYLFALCRQFDLRFLVIADRYDYSAPESATPPPQRTLEDVKERYYTVARRILQARTSAMPSGAATLPQDYLDCYNFDKEQEKERKRVLDKLFRRTQEEIMEEEALVVEVRRIQLQQRKLQRDHEHVMRLLNIREAPSLGPMHAGAQSMASSTGTGAQPYNGANDHTAYTTPNTKQKHGAQQQRATPGTDGTGETTKARKRKLVKKDGTGAALDCPRPVMATERVYAQYEQLRQSIIKMLERKKYADRLEQELRTLNYRKDELKGKTSLLGHTTASELDLADDMTTPKLQGVTKTID